MTAELPYVTPELPGTGGALRVELEDFFVEEIPAYPPQGQGDHIFVHIEKQGLDTLGAIRAMARAVDVSERDVGSAGLKDRRAVTRQLLSFPPPTTPEMMTDLDIDGVRILSATRHPHKLKTGHLRGNQFRLVVRGVDDPTAMRNQAQAVLARLAQPPGCPNWFGAQRFGRDGQNAAAGRALLSSPRGGPRGRKRRLLISAYQSHLFNTYLAQRIHDDVLDRALDGDIMRKTDSGGLFDCTDCAVEQNRLEAGEIVPTGPMFGSKMRAPGPGTEASEREQSILRRESLSPEDFLPVGKLALGTRRPLTIRPSDGTAKVVDPDAIVVQFTLPAGSYATAVMREIMKGETTFPG